MTSPSIHLKPSRALAWHSYAHIGQHRVYGAQWPTVAVARNWLREHRPTPFWRRYATVSAVVTAVLTVSSICT
jgi:hypothetical protein